MRHTSNNTRTPHRKGSHSTAPWMLSLTFIALITWFGIAAFTLGLLRTQQTQLILSSEGCHFLNQNGIATKSRSTDDSCTVIVPFTPSPFGNGGHITLGERQISISDNQVIVVVGVVENQPWTETQTRWVLIASISTVLMLAMLAWVIFLI